MEQKTLLLVMAVLSANLLSRFYGFWVITGRKGGLYFWPAIAVQLLIPLSLPKEHPFLKWLFLSNTCLHVFKLVDYYNRYDSLSEGDRNFRRFFHSFDCLYTADIRKSFVKGAVDRPGAARTLNRGLSYLAFGTAFLLLDRHFGWWSAFGGSSLLDYLTLGVEYYFLCVGLVFLGVGIHRRLGYKVDGFFFEHAKASSPMEFWTRWNVPVHEWLRDNIHKEFGGRRHPYRGLFATFLVSGLFHEYIVSLATNTLNGFMLAYFMAQFLAVVLSISLHNFLRWLLPGYSRVRLTKSFQDLKWFLTLFCVLLPLPLFIHNFNKVFQLHTFRPF